MTCDGNESQNNSGGRRFSKKRIAILSTIGAGTADAAYLSVTINPAIGATIPAVLAFAACPTTCAAMGGTMWLSRRFSNKKRVGRKQQLQRRQQESKEEYSSSEQTAKEQKEKLAVVVVAERLMRRKQY
jgi:hypothetical protein